MKSFLKHLLIIPLIFNGVLFAQCNKYDKELTLLKIKSQQLDSVITNAICCLKDCDYYSKAIVFSIVIIEKSDSVFIDLSANYDLKTTLIFEQYVNLYGCFYYKEHLFVVFLNNPPINFFETTKSKRKFVIHDIGSPVSDYPEWLYLYTSNKFILKKLVNECGNK
ncbi:MAG: hypothetical protein M0R21_10690 [Lentimicrobiaceae bacterium]|nr:hypothetical protein [Lentimicrobiaceae bacterium]